MERNMRASHLTPVASDLCGDTLGLLHLAGEKPTHLTTQQQ